MIYIRTCAYNAENTLRKTIDSVLNQSYTNFKYYILDNGSSDHTGDIIREYAKKDSRIVPFFNIINRNVNENPDFWNLSHHIPYNDYFCILDADDYYSLTFFEEMLRFIKNENLDIAACGSIFVEADGNTKIGDYTVTQNLVLKTAQDWENYFKQCHWNMRQVWGKLYSSKASAARFEITTPEWFPKAYGGDTVNVIECIKASGNFGVYAKPLHYYRVSNKSVSYKWIEGRTESDQILDALTTEFLKKMSGDVSFYNKEFLALVYTHAVEDTIKVINNSDLSSVKKLHEFRKIAENSTTQDYFKYKNQEIGRIKNYLLISAMKCKDAQNSVSEDDFRIILNDLIPKCSAALSLSNIPIFIGRQELLEKFIEDDDVGVVKILVSMVKNDDCVKKFDVISMILALSNNKPLIKEICNRKFIKHYNDIFILIWDKQYQQAVDIMTDVLLTNKTNDYIFISLYLSLAAILNLPDQFILGKVKQASCLAQKNKVEECRIVINDIEEMGVQENDEIKWIKSKIGYDK